MDLVVKSELSSRSGSVKKSKWTDFTLMEGIFWRWQGS